MAQRPSPRNSYTAEQLDAEAEAIRGALAAIGQVTTTMRQTGISKIVVVKDAASERCLRAAKVWSRSVEDGLDEVSKKVVTDRNGSSSEVTENQGLTSKTVTELSTPPKTRKRRKPKT